MFNYIWIDLKIMFRIPFSIFFSLVYPILMMTIILLSYGNIEIGDGFYLVDKYFFISVGMGILPLTLISFPIWIGNSLENNSIKRMFYFHVKSQKIIIGDILAYIFLALIGILTNMLFAFFVFHLKFPSILYFIAFIIQILIAIIIYMILGSIIALLFTQSQILLPFGLVLMFVLYMICGVFISFNELPQSFQNIAKFMPIKYVMNDFFYIWIQQKFFNKDFFLISFIYFIISIFILFVLVKKLNKIKSIQ